MKNITPIILIALVLTLFMTITTVTAAERVKIFELTESGITITFPMTSEEIAAEDPEEARLNSAREANVTKPEKRFHLFEMAESGQTISFAMSAEEIAAEDSEKDKSDVAEMKRNKPRERVIQIELAESGNVIEFSAPENEAVVECTDEIIGHYC